MGKTSALLNTWWNAAIDALNKGGSPAQQWGNVTDDNLLHLNHQSEEPAFAPGQQVSSTSAETDNGNRGWLVERVERNDLNKS
jgi:hypothetical protein